jgi:hypothetical protein
MPILPAGFKFLSTCQVQNEGNGSFSSGTSSKVSQLGGLEINQGAPFENLSKFTPVLYLLKIDDMSLLVEVSLQIEGGYTSKTSAIRFDAIGQGNTEEEAIDDIKAAIKLLKEATSSK